MKTKKALFINDDSAYPVAEAWMKIDGRFAPK